MSQILLYPIGTTPACRYAAEVLQRGGISLTDHPTPEATHLLLDVPSFSADGSLRGGGDLERILSMLPPNITVIGGNLTHPALEEYRCLDLMKDEAYIARNAAITADCALRVAAPQLQTTLRDTPTLILGWGRIGKCLAAMLKALDAPVTVAARKEKDRAMLRALGYSVQNTEALELRGFSLIFNTIPASVLPRTQLDVCPDLVKIELASRPGLEGNGVIQAKGLPGVCAPRSSGVLIAETILKEVTL